MPRRRFITIVCLTTVVLVCGIITFSVMSGRAPEGYYQGRAASSWLREFLGASSGPSLALEAFDKMGTNAQPVLVAALMGQENPFVRMYRGFCARMPAAMQQHLHKPDDPELSRMEAVVVLQHSSSSQIISDLYPLLREPDSAVRLAVLQALKNRVPETGQISWLVLAGNDPDPNVRAQVWPRVTRMGALAASAAPAVSNLCADSNLEVRQDAAWALWKITGQTNTAVPALESALSRSQDARRRHAAAYDLLVMKDASPFFVATLINSLTNGQAADRAIVCSSLGQIGPPAAAAIPALQKALRDPAPEVRRRAEVALSAIAPQPAPTISP